MMWECIHQHLGEDLGSLTAIDLGSHEGWFSYHMAIRGFRRVTGVDARADHVHRSELIRKAYQLTNLEFLNLDIHSPDVRQLPPADLVLMYGLIYHLEDPIGALRTAYRLTERLLLIESQVTNAELTGHIDWGAFGNQIQLQGGFGVVDEPDADNVENGVTGLALVPSANLLLWLLRRIGFSSAFTVAPGPGAHEQLASRKRIVIAALR